MVANVVMTSLQWTQPPVSQSPSCSQTLASPRKRSGNDVVSSLFPHRLSVGAAGPSKLSRARSCEIPKPKIRSVIRRSSSTSFESFSDDEFSKKIEELAMKLHISEDNTNTDPSEESQPESHLKSFLIEDRNRSLSNIEPVESRWGEIYREPPDWPAMDQEIVIKRKANSLDLPFSLKIIRKKQSQWNSGGGLGIRESAYCSVKKAFSSMVFIIQELHSYTLQMREFLFYEDLQGILARVQKEMHASFVWLFQKVFSHTPTLMVYVMILLANFTVHSLASNASVTASPETLTATVEVTSTLDSTKTSSQKFDSSSVKTFSVSGTGYTAAVGGNHGGGGNSKPVASGADGEGRTNRSSHLHPGTSNKFSPLTAREEESVSRQDEISLWNAIINEASRMQAEMRDDSLDSDTIQKFVSPVTVKIESDEEYPEFFRTELLYRTGLAQEPGNPLLLANFAQFLYTVAHDNDRAEEYFKAAMSIEPKDAEACNKYANFLWHIKKDLWGAEETYLEAISAEPSNTYYAANYAHFLWSTGGEDTCYPLDAEGAEA